VSQRAIRLAQRDPRADWAREGRSGPFAEAMSARHLSGAPGHPSL